VIPPRVSDNSDIAIEAHDLTLRFGDFTAVNKVSFAIGRGEIFGFLGSNGCGKTTTMKVLTGLMPASEGSATLLGNPVNAKDLATRKRVGFMSQSFSLYGELSVRQNLVLHAQLFDLPKADSGPRIEELIQRFDLGSVAEQPSGELPLGLRQRLSLAVAVLHCPEVLILDEPTSGVDPAARDDFWRLLVELSREQGVTIFLSTHFMNEAQRCDRISLMHAGKVLACDTPDALQQHFHGETLEAAFVTCLEQAQEAPEAAAPSANRQHTDHAASQQARLQPDPPAGSGQSRRQGIVARQSAHGLCPARGDFHDGDLRLRHFPGRGKPRVRRLRPGPKPAKPRVSGSLPQLALLRRTRAHLQSAEELHRRLQRSEIKLALEIPPGFGRDLYAGRQPAVAAWLDGGMPFRAETSRNYVEAVHQANLQQLAELNSSPRAQPAAARLETRFRYNQDVVSVNAIGPGVMALILAFIPAMLTALGIVREKELGSITNFYATPLTRLEFLLGKQAPYLVISLINLALLVAMNRWLFGVPFKGSGVTLAFGGLLYVLATTSMGLLISAFTRTQIAAILGTMIITSLPTIQFSGLIVPRSSLEGAAALMGMLFPAGYFLDVAVGTFTKALDLRQLWPQCLALFGFFLGFTGLSLVMLKKQEA
jgi:ribosome-dependent ATPase